MTNLQQPIVKKISDSLSSLDSFKKELRTNEERKLLLKYPTVYIHNWMDSDKYEVYIGESNNIMLRTKQHLLTNSTSSKWERNLRNEKANLYVIGHDHFNKSLTLDIENRLIQYMISIDDVKRVYNSRGNKQGSYYTDNEFNKIFDSIWKQLRKYDNKLFPSESLIKNSAIFKASPFHKLTKEQKDNQDIIIQKVYESLAKPNKEHQIIFVQGEAGTGKTVLNSSTFYEIYSRGEDLKCYLMVNHDEQLTVYKHIAEKLCINDFDEIVCKPTNFINKINPDSPVDVAFVDEAHLLLTQGKMSYRGENQLKDIIERSRVTVVMYDENQILTTEQYWEDSIINEYKKRADNQGNLLELKNQLRIKADKHTIDWINEFTKNLVINDIPTDSKGYDIKVFKNPRDLDITIETKAKNMDSSLSRLTATYDWNFERYKRPDNGDRYWEVKIDNWRKPWNYERIIDYSHEEKHSIKSLAWAEQKDTINEVGSTFTIQGFDLNYAGVILGPSVKYRNGKIVFDPNENCYNKVKCSRTLSDGTKKKFGEDLIKHQVRVLMTRGVNGLYIYACDKELRDALIKATNNQLTSFV